MRWTRSGWRNRTFSESDGDYVIVIAISCILADACLGAFLFYLLVEFTGHSIGGVGITGLLHIEFALVDWYQLDIHLG
jgi:hypothetical protein